MTFIWKVLYKKGFYWTTKHVFKIVSEVETLQECARIQGRKGKRKSYMCDISGLIYVNTSGCHPLWQIKTNMTQGVFIKIYYKLKKSQREGQTKILTKTASSFFFLTLEWDALFLLSVDWEMEFNILLLHNNDSSHILKTIFLNIMFISKHNIVKFEGETPLKKGHS